MLKDHNCGELRISDAGMDVKLAGWVESIRIQGKIGFLLLRDRTGIIQCFLNPQLATQIKDVPKESVLSVSGKLNKRPENQIKKEMPTGEVELEAQNIEVLNRAETPLPIIMDEETTTGIDKRLDARFLDVRRNKVKVIFLIRSMIYQKTVEFFSKEKFVSIQTPKLTQSGVESGAEEFKIPYFGKTASLAQSPQVYKQMFVASGLERVYEIAPVFRAEKSHTTRHVTEFTGIDFEMGFIKDETDIMDVIENYFKFLIKAVKKECAEELKLLNVSLKDVESIPRISMIEIRKWLKNEGKAIPEDEDLDAEGEKLLYEMVLAKYNSEFVFVLDYPWKKRPFYHMRHDDNKNITKSFDLIYKGVEIATGAQREHRLEVLEAQADEKGIDLANMKFYRDIFRFGCPPHGGVGFGLDRITERMLNLDNIREAILLPRDPERLTP